MKSTDPSADMALYQEFGVLRIMVPAMVIMMPEGLKNMQALARAFISND